MRYRQQSFRARLFRSMSMLPAIRTAPRPWSTLTVVTIAAVALIVGGFSGAVITYSKQMDGTSPAGLIVYGLTVLLVFAFIALHRRYLTVQAIAAIAIETFALWIGVLIGYLVMTERSSIVDDVFEITLGTPLAVTVGAAVLLALLHLYNHPRLVVGPYCPSCGYCLVGVTRSKCPECGRPFTCAQLGIDEYELRP